jgi:diguanylate cyclase (GGDEF)-like protein
LKTIYIAYTDIDDFKQINDQHSQGVGDEVLVRIGKIMQHFSNEKLIMSQFGGEEFLFCINGYKNHSVK